MDEETEVQRYVLPKVTDLGNIGSGDVFWACGLNSVLYRLDISEILQRTGEPRGPTGALAPLCMGVSARRLTSPGTGKKHLLGVWQLSGNSQQPHVKAWNLNFKGLGDPRTKEMKNQILSLFCISITGSLDPGSQQLAVLLWPASPYRP